MSYQVSISHTLQFLKYSQTKFYRSRSLWQGQRSNQGLTLTLKIYNSQPMSLPSIIFLYLVVSEIDPRQDFIGQGHYGKVISRTHHDTTHLQPQTSVPTKYQLPTPYSCRDIVRPRYYGSRSLQQSQRSNQGHTMMLIT